VKTDHYGQYIPEPTMTDLDQLTARIANATTRAADAQRQAMEWAGIRERLVLEFYERTYGIKVGGTVTCNGVGSVVRWVNPANYPDRPHAVIYTGNGVYLNTDDWEVVP